MEDRAREQSGRLRADDHVGDVRRAGRLTAERDPTRVTPERADLPLNPVEHRKVVEQAPVAKRPPERAEPVTEGDDDDLRGVRKPGAIVNAGSRPPDRPAATDRPHEDRPVAGPGRRRPHVQIQTVLVARGDLATGELRDRSYGLRRRWPRGERVEFARPRRERKRGMPAALRDWGRGVRDPEVGAVATADATAGQFNACAEARHRGLEASGADGSARSRARAAP